MNNALKQALENVNTTHQCLIRMEDLTAIKQAPTPDDCLKIKQYARALKREADAIIRLVDVDGSG